MSFKSIFFLLNNTPLEKKMIEVNYTLEQESQGKYEEYKKATKNAISMLRSKSSVEIPNHEKDQLIELKERRIKELESVNEAIGMQFKNQSAYMNNFNNDRTPPRPIPSKLSKNALNALDYGNSMTSRNRAINQMDTYSLQE